MKIIPKGMGLTLGRQILKTKMNSPKILFAAGVVGVVGSAVLACRATLKLDGKVDAFKDDIEAVNKKHGEVAKNPEVMKQNHGYRKDMSVVYGKNTIDILKLYGPSVLVGAASIAALTGSHVVLSRRNTALSAAYSAVAASYETYRERVRREVGEEKERDLYRGIVTQSDIGFDGKVEKYKTLSPTGGSPYAKLFDELNVNWQKQPEFNYMYVRVQEQYLNDLLHSRGHVFLNEAYDQLGIDRTPEGQIVGWVLNQGGDNYIDFGLDKPESRDFKNGWEPSILLDFNVDGNVYDKI